MKQPATISANTLRYHGLIATALLLLAALGSWLSPGYSHGELPLALLGAKGMPYAAGFNLLAYIAPGLLAAHLGWALRRYWHAHWGSRIGGNVLMLSGLAFAAQGIFPLDPGDLDGAVSQRHAAAWMLWWLAFVIGAGLLAWGERGRDARVLVRSCVLAATALALLAVVLPPVIGPALAQRAGVAVWLTWLVIAGRVSRSAA